MTMLPRVRIAVLGAVVLAAAFGAQALRGATAPLPRVFPQVALPAAASLAPGEPIQGLDIAATWVAAAYLDGDQRPDLLAASAGGDVRGLLNVAGIRPGPAVFQPGPFARSYGAAIQDLLVQDLDGDGSHDLAFLLLEDPRSESPRSRLALEFASGQGAFAAGDCFPELSHVDGRMPVALGAADADRDGRIDLLLDLAPVRTGRIGSLQVPSGAPRSALILNRDDGSGGGTDGGSGGGGGGASSVAYILTDHGASFPEGLRGARIVPDVREGRSFPVTASTSTTLTFAVDGASSIAAAGSAYRLLLPVDRTVVLRGLGERCFDAAWPVVRPVYDARHGADGTVLVDSSANLRPANAFAGRLLRYGPAPLASDAPTIRIAAHTATEFRLDPAAGDLTPALPGVARSLVPAVYSVLPVSVEPPTSRARNERSSLPLPADYPVFRPPGSTGSPRAAVADFTGDRNPDVVVASGQLFLLRQR